MTRRVTCTDRLWAVIGNWARPHEPPNWLYLGVFAAEEGYIPKPFCGLRRALFQTRSEARQMARRCQWCKARAVRVYVTVSGLVGATKEKR